ncbi:hypothetical protein [uncultured Eubacterium sp.]|uniref:hypothetical protein n=1 Tax=Eubacterium sp. TaxID=142586 RepID=UPI003266AB06
MRLIDADEVILHLNDFMLQQSPIDVQDIESIKVSAVIQDCIKAIENQPTAYDVDKVVKELEELPQCSTWNHNSNNIDRIKAINIVKAGGTND